MSLTPERGKHVTEIFSEQRAEIESLRVERDALAVENERLRRDLHATADAAVRLQDLLEAVEDTR